MSLRKFVIMIVTASILAAIVLLISFGIKVNNKYANGYPQRTTVHHKHHNKMNFFDSVQYFPEVKKIRAMNDSALVVYLSKFCETK